MVYVPGRKEEVTTTLTPVVMVTVPVTVSTLSAEVRLRTLFGEKT